MRLCSDATRRRREEGMGIEKWATNKWIYNTQFGHSGASLGTMGEWFQARIVVPL